MAGVIVAVNTTAHTRSVREHTCHSGAAPTRSHLFVVGQPENIPLCACNVHPGTVAVLLLLCRQCPCERANVRHNLHPIKHHGQVRPGSLADVVGNLVRWCVRIATPGGGGTGVAIRWSHRGGAGDLVACIAAYHAHEIGGR